MQFVEHDPFQRAKQKRRIVRRQQQRQLFGVVSRMSGG